MRMGTPRASGAIGGVDDSNDGDDVNASSWWWCFDGEPCGDGVGELATDSDPVDRWAS